MKIQLSDAHLREDIYSGYFILFVGSAMSISKSYLCLSPSAADFFPTISVIIAVRFPAT